MTRFHEQLVSAFLPTDSHETIAPVVERPGSVRAAGRIEPILVPPDADALRAAVASESGFRAVVVRILVLTLPTTLLLFAAKAFGELIGYAGLAKPAHPDMQARDQPRRLEYVSPCRPRHST